MANKFVTGLKEVVAVVAPTMGAALGGPLGGAAGNMIAKAMGKPGATPEQLEEAVVNATPEELKAIREADREFEKFLKEADIKLVDIDAQDRANAREREKALRDWTPMILSFAITGGFFGILFYILLKGLPMTGTDALLLMLGALGTSWGSIVAYYFGSSAGSKAKDAALNAAMKK